MNGGALFKRNKPLVLLVEDDPFYLTALTLALENHGFMVVIARDGLEAKIIYNKLGDGIHAVLASIKMTMIDVEQFALFNGKEHNIPFVVHSDKSDHDLAVKISGLGVSTFIITKSNIRPVIRVMKSTLLRKERQIPQDINCPLYPDAGSLTIRTALDDLSFAQSWMRNLLRDMLSREHLNSFATHAGELLLNAYEHGNLGMTFEKKTELIESGKYEEELKEKEKWCKLNIFLKFALLGDKPTLSIRDEGCGFDFKKHLSMSEDDMARNLLKPNGRGIFLAFKYFESIKYVGSGNEVVVVGKTEGRK
jgi:anti-sigma regulatory factor (Ser/Thr protein kinase)/CheY-like chemotaxis protein